MSNFKPSKSIKKLEKKIKFIAREKSRADENVIAKKQFFDNVCHEFRTPLTLILGRLEDALSKNHDEKLIDDLEGMKRCALRLQGMINELLENSSMESGKLKLKAKEENIVPIVREYIHSFDLLATQKNIKIDFKSKAAEYKVWVNKEQVRKIMANLLSNAFKFTGEGGKISVSVSSGKSIVHYPLSGASKKLTGDIKKGIFLKVADTGIGIDPEKLPHIFERFYRVEDESQRLSLGNGIGLAFTKVLAELHHGNIHAESTPGKGTTFTVFIPVGIKHLHVDDMVSEKKSVTAKNLKAEMVDEKKISTPAIEEKDMQKNGKPIVLIVDDSPDMLNYIQSILKMKYKILKAKDGVEGFVKAVNRIPNLVISDVLMPKMDGNEFCRKLKNDERTCHIPVILLTAKTGDEARLKGLGAGADAYLVKPFNKKELFIRLKQLVELRKKLLLRHQPLHHKGITKTQVRLRQNPTLDDLFLRKVNKIVEANLGSSHFGCSDLAEKMFLSVSQLFRKLKALTNQSTANYIRSIRLQKANELLRNSKLRIAEIAYETGFSDPAYFSRTFLKEFGVSPSAVRK